MPLKGNDGSSTSTTAELATELEQIVRERMVGDGVLNKNSMTNSVALITLHSYSGF